VLLRERSAGLTLEVLFESDGLRLVAERHGRLDMPRRELCCVCNPPTVMDLEPFIEILCHANVPMAWGIGALEHVDVPELAFHGCSFFRLHYGLRHRLAGTKLAAFQA
jgi:hypothetical protein